MSDEKVKTNDCAKPIITAKEDCGCRGCDQCDQQLARLFADVTSRNTLTFSDNVITILNSTFENRLQRELQLNLLYVIYLSLISEVIERFKDRCSKNCCDGFVDAVRSVSIEYFISAARILSTANNLGGDISNIFSELLLNAYNRILRTLNCDIRFGDRFLELVIEECKKKPYYPKTQ